MLAAAIILTFTTMEFLDYRRVTMDTSVEVDRSRGEKLTVRMNVTFPRVPCYRTPTLLIFLPFQLTLPTMFYLHLLSALPGRNGYFWRDTTRHLTQHR